MNTTKNFSENHRYLWASQASSFIDNYVTRSVAFNGVFINIFLVILLSHRTLQHKLYDFMFCRVICNLLALIFVAINIDLCMRCEYKNEWTAYYSLYHNVLLRLMTFSTFISDIFFITKRYYELTKEINFLSLLSKKLNLLISILFPVSLSIPLYYAVSVVRLNKFYIKKINASGIFTVYYFLIILFESVIPLVILLFLYILSIKKFKQTMQTHTKLTRNETESKKAVQLLTLLTVLTVLTRILDFFTSIYSIITFIYLDHLNTGFDDLLNFSKSLNSLFLYGNLALDALIYISMDKNLRVLVLKLFGINRVSEIQINVLFY